MDLKVYLCELAQDKTNINLLSLLNSGPVHYSIMILYKKLYYII